MFKLSHQCESMKYEDYIVYHKNAIDEWEHELSLNAHGSMDNYKDWCAVNNFGVNTFVINPAFLPASKIRNDAGSNLRVM